MSFTVGVVLLFLAGADGEPVWSDEPTASELKPKSTSPKMSFDALPPPPKASDDARVKRFLGALAGGVVGLGAGVAMMPLGDTAAGGCFGGPCVSVVHGLAGILMPLLSVTGAWLGYQLLGGDGGWLTPLIALPPAVLIALGLLSIAGVQDANTALSLMPALIASGAFLVGGSALALDLRSRHVERLGAAASWGKAGAGRVAVTSLVTMLAVGGAMAFSAALYPLLGYGGVAVGFVMAGAAAGTFAAAAAAWGVHRALDGRGSYGAALGGFGVGWLATLGGLGLYALSQSAGGFNRFNPLRSSAGTILFVELVAVSAVFLPVLALEWSHTNAVEASLPKFTFSAAPTPQGGMVAAAMRF